MSGCGSCGHGTGTQGAADEAGVVRVRWLHAGGMRMRLVAEIGLVCVLMLLYAKARKPGGW